MRTKKRRKGGSSLLARVLPGDSKLTGIQFNGTPISCAICGTKEFQVRNASFQKSKLQNYLMDLALGESGGPLNDISVTCYFCNHCGNCITVRDPKSPAAGTYTNLIRPTI